MRIIDLDEFWKKNDAEAVIAIEADDKLTDIYQASHTNKAGYRSDDGQWVMIVSLPGETQQIGLSLAGLTSRLTQR